MDENKVFNKKFFNSKAFDEWHDSLSDILNFFRETFNPDLKPQTNKTDEERAMEYKENLIINSIRLGLYYNKLNEEKEMKK